MADGRIARGVQSNSWYFLKDGQQLCLIPLCTTLTAGRWYSSKNTYRVPESDVPDEVWVALAKYRLTHAS